MKLEVVRFNVSLFLFLFSASLFLNYSLCKSCSFSRTLLASYCFLFCCSMSSCWTSSFYSSLKIVNYKASSNFFFSIYRSRFCCIVSYLVSEVFNDGLPSFSTPLAGETGLTSFSPPELIIIEPSSFFGNIGDCYVKSFCNFSWKYAWLS
jgi:hypothetical protein